MSVTQWLLRLPVVTVASRSVSSESRRGPETATYIADGSTAMEQVGADEQTVWC